MGFPTKALILLPKMVFPDNCFGLWYKAIEKLKYAKEKLLDFIICDHHARRKFYRCCCSVETPNASTLLPLRTSFRLQVGFKFVQAFAM